MSRSLSNHGERFYERGLEVPTQGASFAAAPCSVYIRLLTSRVSSTQTPQPHTQDRGTRTRYRRNQVGCLFFSKVFVNCTDLLFSSGIGRSIAHEYAKRGAKVCVIGRRTTELEGVRGECIDIYEKNGFGGVLQESDKALLTIQADFSQPEDMVRVRSEIETGASYIVSAYRPGRY